MFLILNDIHYLLMKIKEQNWLDVFVHFVKKYMLCTRCKLFKIY